MTAGDRRSHAMVEFIGTFSTISTPVESIETLADGVALFEALSEIAPSYFDPTTIARHLGDNWVLKQSNLRKLLRNLESYYHQELHKDAECLASGGSGPLAVAKIARERDIEGIQVLVELVAAAAVTCPDKNVYVSRIMGLSGEAQAEMKAILQSSLARLQDYHDEDEDANVTDDDELVFGQSDDGNAGHDDLDGGMMDDDSGEGRNLFGSSGYRTVDEDIDGLEQKYLEAKREYSMLKSQMDVAAEDAEKAQSKLRALVEDLQDRLQSRQDDLQHLEQDLQTSNRHLEEVKAQLAEALEQKKQLADDLDVANAKASQLQKAEATVNAYRKKLEGLGSISQQNSDLEDQAAKYLRQIVELEAEVKKSKILLKDKAELEEYVAQLEKKQTDSASNTRETAAEIAGLKSRLSEAENAKKMFEEELAELRAKQENGAAAAADVSVGTSLTDASTTEDREKVMRLQVENKTLQEQVEALQKEIEGLKEQGSASGLNSEEAQRLQQEIAALKKENAKISTDKDKLEAYTKRTLAKFQDKYLVALQECKAKLKEKQDKIEALEARNASERTAQKREERLLSSTIYELGLGIMQNRLKTGSS